MTAPALDVTATPDLTACDREPIHVPGTIQPHGFLVAVDEATWTVRHVSENVREYLALEPLRVLGLPIESVIGRTASGLLRQAASDPLSAQRAISVDKLRVSPRGEPQTFMLIAHRRGGFVVVEGEFLREDNPGALPDTHYQLETFLSRMEAATSIDALLQQAAEETRRITGFDRVMVYKFDPDWNGIVIAEDRNDVLPSYLDLRFPASDIPQQARELYRTNRLRLIASAEYEPVKVLAGTRTTEPLDMSLATLRSVSPVHLEYMRNMGTGSSMSISVMRGGQLWGLISCHSRAPRVIPFEVRTTCDLLGQVLSLQLAGREEAGILSYRMQLRSVLATLLGSMSRHNHFGLGLMAEAKEVLALTDAAGFAVVIDGVVEIHGRTPTKAQVGQIVEWLTGFTTADVYTTDTLPGVFPPAKEFAWSASGLLAASISRVHKSYVLWFRPEVIGTVTWGGDPSKPVHSNGDQVRLHPRKSFEAWIQTVRGHSQPWRPPEIEAARELRTGVITIVLQSAERLAQLTEELTRTNKELEAFSYTVSHDLRAPFRHIRAYAEMLKIDKGRMLDDEGREFLDYVLSGATYAGRMVDNILAFSQMGRRPLQMTSVPLNELVDHILSDLRVDVTGRDLEWHISELPTVEADPAMLRTALQNLIENAVKYSRDRKPARIEIRAASTPVEHIVSVEDNGVGFDMKYKDKLFGMFQRLHRWEEFEGTGIGLASVRRIIGRHGGRVWAESEIGAGSTFHFALPKTAPASTPLYA